MTKLYTPAKKPWKHQQEALRRLEGQKAFALLMAMRTGKTKVTLDDFGQLELDDKAKDLLVIAPAGVYETWRIAREEHVSWDLNQRLRFHLWQSGAGNGHRKALNHILTVGEGQPRMMVMNIEALSSVADARSAAIGFLKARPHQTVVAVDESTTIKNPSSKRTKFVIQELGHYGEYRRILTGLPTPRNPLDIYSQFEFLDWKILGFRSYYSFRARYANIFEINVSGAGGTTRKVPLIKGFVDVDEIHEKIAPYSYRVRMEDCYDVPDKEYVIREVHPTNEQKRIYKELKEYMTAQITETEYVSSSVVVAQMIRLHQVLCGHVTDEQGKFHEISDTRIDEILALLEEYDGKAVIWCAYDYNVRQISSALERAYGQGSVARFWGGNRNTREEEEKLFLNKPECRFMVATASAGGRGRMWAVANLVIYHSNTDNLENRSQSEDRTQLIGKRDFCTYVDLVAKGTVDEKFLYAMRNKINLAAVITGDNWREWVV